MILRISYSIFFASATLIHSEEAFFSVINCMEVGVLCVVLINDDTKT